MDFSLIPAAVAQEKRDERKAAARERMNKFVQEREAWKESTCPWWRDVMEDIRKCGGFLVPSERFIGQDFTKGSYISPVWRRYSHRMGEKNVPIQKRAEWEFKLRHAEGARLEDVVKQALENGCYWHDELEGEQALVDVFAGLQKQDIVDQYREFVKGERSQVEQFIEEQKQAQEKIMEETVKKIAARNAFLAAATSLKDIKSLMGGLASDKCLSVKRQTYIMPRVTFVDKMVEKALASGATRDQLRSGLEVRERKNEHYKRKGPNGDKVFVTCGWYLGEVAYNYAKYIIEGGKSMQATVDEWLKNGRKFPEEAEAEKKISSGYVFTPDGMEAPVSAAPKPFTFEPDEEATGSDGLPF